MLVAAPGIPGGWELLIIVLILILLFGAKKLPELARGTGRALRIFKSETRGLMDDDDDEEKPPAQPRQQIAPPTPVQPEQPAQPAQPTEQPKSDPNTHNS
jgi:sec-independent protein translocase protein TatA